MENYRNKTRQFLLNFFLSIGAYTSAYGRQGLAAFAFNVKLHVYMDEQEKYQLVYEHIRDEFGDTEYTEHELSVAIRQVLADENKLILIDHMAHEAMSHALDQDWFDVVGNPVDVEFKFVGRSCGYLALKTFNGYDVWETEDEMERAIYRPKSDDETWEEYRDECAYWYEDYQWLMQLYKFVRLLQIDIEDNKIHEREYKYQYIDVLSFMVLEQVAENRKANN